MSTTLDPVSMHSRKSSSQFELTSEQISVLELGLSFVPISVSDLEILVFFMDLNCKLDETDKFYIKM